MDDQRTDRKRGELKEGWYMLPLAAYLIYDIIDNIIKRDYWHAFTAVGFFGFVVNYLRIHLKK